MGRQRKKTRYTEEEIRFITRWWGRKTPDRIAKSLRRPLHGIYMKARAMNLPRLKAAEWSEDELRTLRFYHGQETVRQIADRLGRTYFATVNMIHRLGLDASRKIYVDAGIAKQLKGSLSIHWTSSMINTLRRYYPCTPSDDVVAMLGISLRTTQRKAAELGIAKSPEWIAEKNRKGLRMARITNMTRGNSGQWQHRPCRGPRPGIHDKIQ